VSASNSLSTSFPIPENKASLLNATIHLEESASTASEVSKRKKKKTKMINQNRNAITAQQESVSIALLLILKIKPNKPSGYASTDHMPNASIA
jgi:hypothetical protein